MYPLIQTLLVPQGREYQAVKRGICQQGCSPSIAAVPVGTEPCRKFLEQWHPDSNNDHGQPPRVLLMGLCGSLTSEYRVGDIVLYDSCVDAMLSASGSPVNCDVDLTQQLQSYLQLEHQPVKAFTSDRLVFRAQDKQALAAQYQADVVDMEGMAALQVLKQRGFAVAMLRVVSDGAEDDIPDLTAAFSADGQLLPLPLAVGMLRQPLGAARLIRGSLRGLKVLEQVACQLPAVVATA